MHQLLLGSLSILNWFFSPRALADASSNTLDLKSLNPLGATNLLDLLTTVLKGAVYIATPIASLMVLYGAFRILTAGPDPNKVKEGRQIITWAIIGYIIVLVAGGITSIVTDFLNGGKGGLTP